MLLSLPNRCKMKLASDITKYGSAQYLRESKQYYIRITPLALFNETREHALKRLSDSRQLHQSHWRVYHYYTIDID